MIYERVGLDGYPARDRVRFIDLQGRGPRPIWVALVSDGVRLVLWAIIARAFVRGVVADAVNAGGVGS